MTEEIGFRDRRLIPIWQKVRRGERLSFEDGMALYATRDLISLGQMAHAVQQTKSGDAVYFVLNQKIEHTNISPVRSVTLRRRRANRTHSK